jgi:hypothetical protein
MGADEAFVPCHCKFMHSHLPPAILECSILLVRMCRVVSRVLAMRSPTAMPLHVHA